MIKQMNDLVMQIQTKCSGISKEDLIVVNNLEECGKLSNYSPTEGQLKVLTKILAKNDKKSVKSSKKREKFN